MSIRRLLPLVAALASLGPLRAQTHVMPGSADPLAIPKWEDVFADGPFDLPDETIDPGAVAPVLTAANDEANGACRIGLAALHRYDLREAERAFRLAVTRDEACAIGYLGLALANDRLPGRASVFWQRAKKHREGAAPFERALVDAYEPYFHDVSARTTGVEPTTRRLEALAGDARPGAEANGLLVLWHIDRGQEAAARGPLDRLLAAHPGHPAATHRLRLIDPRAADQTKVFDALLACCPPNPGALSLAGDRLERAGRFAESALFWAAAEAAAIRRHPSDMEEWRGIEESRRREVGNLASAGRVQGLQRRAEERTAAVRDGLIRLERWGEVLALPAPTAKAPLLDRAADAHGRALAGFALGQEGTSFPFIASLQVLKAEARRPSSGTTAADMRRLDDWETELQLHNLLARAAGADVVSRLGSLPTVPPLRRARLAAAAGDLTGAADEAARAVEAHPHALPETAMRIETLMALGKTDEARALFRSPFGEIVPDTAIESALPAVSRLDAVARVLGLPVPWWPASPRSEVAPSLDGVALRAPGKPDTVLPTWTLRDGTGTERPLPTLITQTTVFVFFLGHRCVHCMNQLNTFAPMAGKLRAAGAQIIAISADDPAGVAETFAGGEPGVSQQKFPFLILADNEKKAFRAWGVHDRFLDSPIHGVFIVDGDGRLRWRHLGVEPFTHVGDVLAACEAIKSG